MGNSGSKAASATSKAVSGAARRQYPSSPSILNSATSTSNAPSYQQPPPPPDLNTSTPPLSQPSSQVHPDPRAAPPSETRSTHIDLDGRDPQFASSLRKLGPAVPKDETHPHAQAFPTSSQPPQGQQGQNIFPPSPSSPSTTSTSNPSLKIVHARERIAARYAQETESMGRSSFAGRTLVTAKEIRSIISLRTQGKSESDIEKQLRLKPGVVRDLIGARGIVENV